ncbi:MAG TPA: hypothetical protein P5110_05440 [Candidatus Omnitrophota bacterium]|nr:hypothetical protein [Candidatus Omnitrophota bacterium]
MRNEKIGIVLISIAIVGIVTIYYQASLRKMQRVTVTQSASQERAIADLQSEMAAFAQAQAELKKALSTAEGALQQERTTTFDLQQKLARSIGENKLLSRKIAAAVKDTARIPGLEQQIENAARGAETLKQEVDTVRHNFELVQSVRARISEIERSLADLRLKPGKEEVIKVRLEGMTAELGKMNQYLAGLREARSPVTAAPSVQSPAPVNLEREKVSLNDELKFREEIQYLKNQSETVAKDNAVLKEKYRLAQDLLNQNKADLSGKEERIFSLQSRLIEMESHVNELQRRYEQLEKDAVSLKEKYIASELEKEDVRSRLAQTTAELNEVRKKFVDMLGKISSVFKGTEEAQHNGAAVSPPGNATGGQGKVAVELIPQQPRSAP